MRFPEKADLIHVVNTRKVRWMIEWPYACKPVSIRLPIEGRADPMR